MGIMEKFFVDGMTDRILLGDEQWVEIKKKFSIADQDALKQQLLEIELNATPGLSRGERRRRAKDGEVQHNVKVRPSTVALLRVAIVDWSFTDKDNNKIPITPEWIGCLKDEWAYILEDAIEERNNPLSEQVTPQ